MPETERRSVQAIGSETRSVFGGYDVLCYFVPGSTLLGSIFAFEWAASLARCGVGASFLACSPQTPVYSTLTTVFRLQTGSSAFQDALIAATLLLLAYVVGHVVASVSAFTIDRMYVSQGFGYPIQHYLAIDNPDTEKQLDRCFVKGTMFFLNAYLLLRYLALPGVLSLDTLLPNILPTIFPQFASPQNLILSARIASAALMTGIVAYGATRVTRVLRRRSNNWKRIESESVAVRVLVKALAWLVWCFAQPSRLVTSPIGNVARTLRNVDTGTSEAFRARLRQLTNSEAAEMTSAAYWLPYIEIRRYDPSSVALMENWLKLYSFARNIATAFYTAFIYCSFWWLAQGERLHAAREQDLVLVQTIPPILFAGAFLMLQRYFFLYADYYTKFLIRAFAYPRDRRVQLQGEASGNPDSPGE